MLTRIVLTVALIAPAVLLRPALPVHAQSSEVSYAGALSFGHAFMVDIDDPDPAGGSSFSASVERRIAGRAMSIGIEAGLHRYHLFFQDLVPDITGWSNTLEDKRRAWRITPYVRWRTRGDVSVHAQLGAGVYVRETSYFQQEREEGVTVYETRYETRRAKPGINLGIGAELLIPGTPVGLGLGLRTHAGGGDGFSSAEIGLVWRTGGKGVTRSRNVSLPTVLRHARRHTVGDRPQ